MIRSQTVQRLGQAERRGERQGDGACSVVALHGTEGGGASGKALCPSIVAGPTGDAPSRHGVRTGHTGPAIHARLQACARPLSWGRLSAGSGSQRVPLRNVGTT